MFWVSGSITPGRSPARRGAQTRRGGQQGGLRASPSLLPDMALYVLADLASGAVHPWFSQTPPASMADVDDAACAHCTSPNSEERKQAVGRAPRSDYSIMKEVCELSAQHKGLLICGPRWVQSYHVPTILLGFRILGSPIHSLWGLGLLSASSNSPIRPRMHLMLHTS